MASFEQEPQKKYVKPNVKINGGFDFSECDNLLARDYIQGNEILLVRNITPAGESAQEVKITDGTDTLIINPDGSINVNKNLTDKTVNRISFAHQATTVVTTFGTVPANKKWYILGVLHTSGDYGNSRAGYCAILANGAAISYSEHPCYSTSSTSNSNFINISDFQIILTAGQTIQHQLTTGGYHSGVVFYIEEDA